MVIHIELYGFSPKYQTTLKISLLLIDAPLGYL